MAKAKAGRTATDVALRCIALCGSAGYAETELLEKWARDAKILDIFEGTQQIQLPIIARQLLKKTSAELKERYGRRRWPIGPRSSTPTAGTSGTRTGRCPGAARRCSSRARRACACGWPTGAS